MKRTSEYFIYAIVVDAPDKSLVKVGRTSSVRQRVSEIQTGCPYDIRLVLACDVLDAYEGGMREAVMHELYADWRVRGEWFSPWQRVASESDINDLQKNLMDTGMDRLQAEFRGLRMDPYIDAAGNRRMRTTQLSDVPGPVIEDEDGYPMARPWAVGDVKTPIAVVVKPRRRIFTRC